LKLAAELAVIAKSLKSSLNKVESETKTMIAVGHLDNAERNLPLVDLLSSVLTHVDTIDGTPFSALSSVLREKR
jgi:hypothetical protein